MDVSAIASGTGTPAPAASENPAGTGTVVPAATTAPHVQTTAPPEQTAPTHTTLAPAVAKLFGSSSDPQPVALDVSYRVLKGNLGEIVTVFTDPKTGKEIAQFPPEILIGLATFFDQQSGATLDQSA